MGQNLYRGAKILVLRRDAIVRGYYNLALSIIRSSPIPAFNPEWERRKSIII